MTIVPFRVIYLWDQYFGWKVGDFDLPSQKIQDKYSDKNRKEIKFKKKRFRKRKKRSIQGRFSKGRRTPFSMGEKLTSASPTKGK